MVKSAIFSGVVNERLFLEYEFDDFFYKSEAEAVVEQVEQVLQRRSSEFMVESVYSYFGENRASSAIVLSRKNLDDDEAGALRKRIREALPEVAGARMTFRDEADEGGSSTYFAVKLFGQDSTVLHDLAEEVARRLETVAGIEDVSRPRSAGRREIHVAVDRDRAAELGLTADDVARLLAFSLGGLRLDRFSTGEREITTWLALRQEDRVPPRRPEADPDRQPGRPAGAARRPGDLLHGGAAARDRAREPQGTGGGSRHLRGRRLEGNQEADRGADECPRAAGRLLVGLERPNRRAAGRETPRWASTSLLALSSSTS